MNGLKTCLEVYQLLNHSENKRSSEGGDGLNSSAEGYSKGDGNENMVSTFFMICTFCITSSNISIILISLALTYIRVLY